MLREASSKCGSNSPQAEIIDFDLFDALADAVAAGLSEAMRISRSLKFGRF
jgi:hypothetical protein